MTDNGQGSIFAEARRQMSRSAPLSHRMRPRTLDEFVGQEHLVGPGRLLRRAVEADRLTNMIFHGPPGSGKTALAEIIAGHTGAQFQRLNAVTAGVADVRKVIQTAAGRLESGGGRTVLFIDEIHRFNKAQQDALLPALAEGTIILIGATTENPYFTITGPLLSRSRLFRFEALSDEHIRLLLQRAIADKERGLGTLPLTVAGEALDHWVSVAAGDARNALNALELAALTTSPDEEGRIVIDQAVAAESIQQRVLAYDRQGDGHYDHASAFIKSMRGSDPDAAVYWLARMLAAGEDPRFLARRMVVHAAEDVGMADPQALVVATAAAQALELVGMPEARLPLAMAAIYIATAPKSNAVYRAINKAGSDVRSQQPPPVPAHLRDSSYQGAKAMGHGKGYLYPHNFPQGFVEQQYLPDGVQRGTYYQPTEYGLERKIAQRLAAWWSHREPPA